jgi:hypothetical protein
MNRRLNGESALKVPGIAEVCVPADGVRGT